MAAPKKRRALGKSNEEDENVTSSEGEGDHEDMDYESENSEQENDQQVIVDFEAQVPVDSDFHGIKQLLQQLFLKAQLNLAQLTELILKQNYIGSVLKQAEDSEESDEEDDHDATFGLTSAINITDKKETECIKQLKDLLLEQCTKYSTSKNKELLQRLLSDNSKHIGFLISERLINIPAKVSVPMYESLIKEIEEAQKKKMAFNFEYFLIISKTYKSLPKDTDKPNDDVFFTNAEEEYFQEEAILKFDYPVVSETGTAIGGKWDFGDEEMTPSRTVMVLPASKLSELVEKLKEAVA